MEGNEGREEGGKKSMIFSEPWKCILFGFSDGRDSTVDNNRTRR